MGKFPRDWKFARVVSIPKTGAKDNPANYRPTSLQSFPSSVETCSQLSERLPKRSLSSISSPMGPKKFYYTAILSLTYNCLESLDMGKKVCAVFFDLSKAFDSVLHGPLPAKIRSE